MLPELLTFHECTTNAEIRRPHGSRPADTPFGESLAIATVEIGEIINVANEQQIKIDIKIGCNVVRTR